MARYAVGDKVDFYNPEWRQPMSATVTEVHGPDDVDVVTYDLNFVAIHLRITGQELLRPSVVDLAPFEATLFKAALAWERATRTAKVFGMTENEIDQTLARASREVEATDHREHQADLPARE
jgi:hypothetical protein